MPSTLTSVLWLTSPILDILLLGSILQKKRWKQFPIFSVAIGIDAIIQVSLFLIDPSASGETYRNAYRCASVISFVTQLAILIEIAKAVLRQPNRWNAGALHRLWAFGFAGGLFALLTTWIVSNGKVFGWAVAVDDMQIFSGLATCELVIAVSLAAGQLGLPIRSHVLAIGQGLAAWALLAVSIYGVETFVSMVSPIYQGLEILRALLYPLTVLYWTVSLWYEEPARRPISPAMHKYIVAIHDQVQYDLGKASR